MIKLDDSSTPILSHDAIRWLEQNLQSSWNVLEFGAGASTIWFAQRVATITSIEHDDAWFDAVQKASNERVYLQKFTRPFGLEMFQSFPNKSYDLVIVDGRERVFCAKGSYSKVKSGGYFIFDDMHRSRYDESVADIQAMGWQEITGLGRGGPGDNARITRIWKVNE